jgi:hypothetical protein
MRHKGWIAVAVAVATSAGCGLSLSAIEDGQLEDGGFASDAPFPTAPSKDSATDPPTDASVLPDVAITENDDAGVSADATVNEPDAGTVDAGTDASYLCQGYIRGSDETIDPVPEPYTTYNGHCYWISPDPVKGSPLDRIGEPCRNRAGYAVVVTSEEENSVVTNLRKALPAAAEDPWMGVARFGDPARWRWLASPNLVSTFTKLEANLAELGGGCTRLEKSGTWRQANCKTGNPDHRTVCERIYDIP